MSDSIPLDEWMTTTELAAAIGVDAASIAHWRGRGRGFPAGRTDGRIRTYRAGDVLPWLDSRVIPARNRRAEEFADATYGGRLRSHLAARFATGSLRSGPDDPGPAIRDAKALAFRAFPGTTPTAVLDAALLLAFVWVVDETAWAQIESHAGMLGLIAAEVDPVLRKHGIAPAAATVIGELRPARLDTVQRLVNVSAGLGFQGFAAIHLFISETEGVTPSTYRTPQSVA
ncbi:hypothetical protein, partial [Nocardia sp. NPDC058497]|uniref:hypothetical protein n=1 Tax=Nocardia sp. NPDC058497 TaxID=3346529 RepID=UPI0036584655